MVLPACRVTQQTLHVFDLDAKPPACKVFSHLPSTYKVKMDIAGQRKTTSVKAAAWSLVLGKDPLPKEILFSRLYARSRVAVMLNKGGSLHTRSQHPDIATAHGLQYPSSDAQKLSLVDNNNCGTAQHVIFIIRRP